MEEQIMPTDEKCDDYSQRIRALEVMIASHIERCGLERVDVWAHMNTITKDFKDDHKDIKLVIKEVRRRLDELIKMGFIILISFAGTLLFVVYETLK
jgi:hypothetical protein